MPELKDGNVQVRKETPSGEMLEYKNSNVQVVG